MNKILSYTMIITEKKIEYKIKFILLKLKKKKRKRERENQCFKFYL